MMTFWTFTALLLLQGGYVDIKSSGDFEYRADCEMFRKEVIERYEGNKYIKRVHVGECVEVDRLLLAPANIEEIG